MLQINSVGILLIAASFLDGFVTKMYEQSFHKEYVMLSKNFEYFNYNYMFEITQNVGRALVVLLLYVFFKDIKTMLINFLLLYQLVYYLSLKQKRNVKTVLLYGKRNNSEYII